MLREKGEGAGAVEPRNGAENGAAAVVVEEEHELTRKRPRDDEDGERDGAAAEDASGRGAEPRASEGGAAAAHDRARLDAQARAKRETVEIAQLEAGGALHAAPPPECAPSRELEALFVLPAVLKRQLVDDWEFVTKERKLVQLPRDVTVQALLRLWLSSKAKARGGVVDQACKDVAEGLELYFDAALGNMLLYRFERAQYNRLVLLTTQRGDVFQASKVYGAEHFLRLLTKMPVILSKLNVDSADITTIADNCADLAKFIQFNGKLFFLVDYEVADESYCALANETD